VDLSLLVALSRSLGEVVYLSRLAKSFLVGLYMLDS
jgi:hypothetical protein